MTLRSAPDTEPATIARALAGDPSAERELYDAHVDRVYRLMYRLAGEAELAREFTQDAFVRAFDRLATFRGDAAFATWLSRIAVSVALTALRQRKRRWDRETDLETAGPVAGKVERVEPDLRRQLYAAIAALPEGYRTVLVLHELEGYTHEEIGALLEIEPGTSKAQLFRARARLRDALGAHAGDWNR